jgi:Na+/proline symporter
MTIAMITYFAIGSGKFVAEFLGIPAFFGLSPQFWAATLMIILAMIYTVASGLYGVVWTDVFQGVLIFGTIIFICALAFFRFDLPETFQVSVPLRDGGFMALNTTRDAWTNIWPSWTLEMPEMSSYSIYNLFGIAILFYLIKVTIEGSGGTSQYMIQRFFASRSDRESGLLSLFWTFLLAFRWPFIAAIAIMGVVLGTTKGVIQDPETVLPVVINELVPLGVKGILVAGLMAAAMSTFDSTVNAGAAYWVKDLYQTYINPRATEKQLLRHSRWSSVIIVILGLGFMLVISNINEIWGWITSSLGAGLLIPTLARWYWWRMNGYGFAAGTVAGMVAAVLQRLIVLLEFYKRTRPFGLWGPIRKQIDSEKMQEINQENRRDILSTFFAVPWQVVLFLTGMAVILKRWDQFGWLLIILAALSAGLYFNWFRHLSKEVKID